MELGNENRSSFREKILISVADALDTYGMGVSKIVFYHFQKRTGLEAIEIANRPEEFSQTIRDFFGISGSAVEAIISRRIRQGFDLGRGVALAKPASFVEVVKAARQMKLKKELTR